MKSTNTATIENITTVTTTLTVKDPTVAPTPIDHSKDILISNKATYSELLAVLRKRPEMADSIKTEQAEKRREAEEDRLRMELGDDYESFVRDPEQDTVSEGNIVLKKTRRRPGAIQLRTNFPRVAMIKIGKDGLCEVFSNGYAVYDNGNRRTVLWVFDCRTVTYYFNGLRDNQKDYLKQKDTTGKEFYRTVRERILRPRPSNSGHLSVVLGHGKHGSQVHQLVMRAFVGEPPKGMEVRHLNGDPTDNRLENLKYGTRTENILDVFYQGKRWRKLSLEDVIYSRFASFCGFSDKDIANELNVAPSTIAQIRKRKSYTWVN